MSDLESPSALPESKKGLINPKVFLIGLPLFIVQLVVVYFVTANILLSKMPQQTVSGKESAAEESKSGEGGSEEGKGKAEIGKNIYNIEDIIVNPAGTNGQRLMLTSIGFDLPSAEQLEKFKSKEVLVKDVIISTLSAKNLAQLGNSQYRDSLKAEIKNGITTHIPQLKINSVYFSKYIIQ